MALDIRTSELKEPVNVSEYLFRRLYEVGIRSIHGVPGDYNLAALDYIPKSGLKWVGNANELNAGYAADGYARIKGMAALVTTFGVGELSAANAIAGAYSEYVPIVHIVGYPSVASQRDGALLHHTLGNGDFTVFQKIFSNISCAVSMLNDPHEAAMLIDNAIRECYIHSRPVYISLPTDMAQKKIEGARLKTPIDLSFKPNDPDAEDYVVDVITKYLKDAQNPVILLDACTIRHHAGDVANEFIKASELPVFVTPMGKGGVDETLPNYGGVYAGSGSNEGVAKRVESSDLVLTLGAIKSDFNTAGFSYKISQLKTIDFHTYTTKVRYSEYPGVRMNGVLKKLTQKLKEGLKLNVHLGSHEPSNEMPQREKDSLESTINHSWLWPRLGQWLQAGDIIITETGTSNFGIWNTRFPKDVKAISQVLWGSIGYATGATQGAALAAKEMGIKRSILWTGDGSFQLTAQAVSDMLRNKLSPYIFVICNDGYTIERFIHGWDAEYNDVQPWKYKDLPAAFGGRTEEFETFAVRTRDELDKLFEDDDFSTPNGKLKFIEVYMPKEDAPETLKMTAESAAKRNA
ncbi:uncharacterized protein PV09_05879 [Verruconis gallopava]|uniref:Pyruvate decarboxylase n=1 Tax=Verruconis gallopava TaxID=253628 RepID=A0A0D1XKG5_9PEZI|nr:uncharacterized protein PV09_05879 [Verruconis gallopava]KIW02821.1 hypothetical protein PV09_05879 [Verruconis gallopava]